MFYNNFEELLTFGTASALIQEDFIDVIRSRIFTIGEYALGFDSSGRLDAFYRQFWMTVKQIIDEFGKENAPNNIKTAYDNNNIDKYEEKITWGEQENVGTSGDGRFHRKHPLGRRFS